MDFYISRGTLTLFYFSVFFIFIQESNGIRCWTCENAISNEDCIDRGRTVDCYSSGMGCSSEVRYHAGFVFKIQIRKGCKQVLACGSDKSQNGHGWYPVQCNPKFPDSICRCCCQTDGCNKNLIGCEPPQPDCKKLVVPKNGYKVCNNEDHPTALRSICTFFCKKGYELEGDYRTECTKTKSGKAIWTVKEPRCTTKTCKPQYKNMPTRKVQCTDSNNAGSECTFTCAGGYIMNGEPMSTCLYSKNWDYPAPDCVKVTCPPPIIPAAHSSMICSNGDELGSVCRYSCESGFSLEGDERRECVLTTTHESAFGSWSGSLPKCIAITCTPKQINPVNGMVDCTDMDYIGSTCTYVCKDDYIMEGSETNSCVWNKTSQSGSWNAEPPVCTPTRCPMLGLDMDNGQLSCTNENNVGSMCALSCSAGSYIFQPSYPDMVLYGWIVSCLYGGYWSQDEATCKKITCSPDVSDGIRYGIVTCSDDNNYQSECGFSCDEGYELVGKQRLVCKETGINGVRGAWDNEPPTCEQMGCPGISQTSKVMKMSCTNRFEEGSVCSFGCKAGYYMSLENSIPYEDDDYSIECSDDRVWSGLVPVCMEIRCFPEMGRSLPNGAMRCSNGNRYKSRCTFSCDVAYGLQGANNIFCTENPDVYGEGLWSKTKPACIRNGCAPILSNPENGRVTCTRRNLFRSTCTFTCNPGSYMKSHDNYLIENNHLESRCSTEGDWSGIPPTCHPITCEPLSKKVERGNMSCSDGNNYMSECKYMCNVGFEVSEDTDTSVCTDQLTSRAFGLWSHEDIKCKRASCKVRQRAPNGGKVACSAGDGVGSKCLFVCYEGYYMNSTEGKLIKQNQFEVHCQKDKTWTAAAPRCQPMKCLRRSFPNGDVSCTNENRHLSTCRFYCLPGYKLDGVNTTRCLGGKDGGTEGDWSEKWPSCKELTCDRRSSNAPRNGFALCSDGARLGSTCEFVCDVGYSLVGEQFLICEADGDSGMAWSSPSPRCVDTKA